MFACVRPPTCWRQLQPLQQTRFCSVTVGRKTQRWQFWFCLLRVIYHQLIFQDAPPCHLCLHLRCPRLNLSRWLGLYQLELEPRQVQRAALVQKQERLIRLALVLPRRLVQPLLAWVWLQQELLQEQLQE